MTFVIKKHSARIRRLDAFFIPYFSYDKSYLFLLKALLLLGFSTANLK